MSVVFLGTINHLRALGFALLMGLAACHAGELVSDAGPPQGDGGTPFACAPISDAALVGCRASDEPNCGRCCLQTAPDSCSVSGVPCDMVVAGQVVSQYCAVFSMPGQCPGDCRPCATCSKYSEASLCSLKPSIDACDCANADIGVDPCIAPDSCGCRCHTYLADLAVCPPP
jgi:hypothetical protein